MTKYIFRGRGYKTVAIRYDIMISVTSVPYLNQTGLTSFELELTGETHAIFQEIVKCDVEMQIPDVRTLHFGTMGYDRGEKKGTPIASTQ